MKINSIKQFIPETDEQFLKEFGQNEVTIPDIITDKGYDIPNGLADQNIFGPVKDYTCRCGELSGIIYEGYQCKSCGVTVAPKSKRLNQFGYFKLHTNVLNPYFSDIIVTKILGLKSVDSENFFNGSQVFFTESSKGGLYAEFNGEVLRGKITFTAGNHSLGFGHEAIHELSKHLIKNPPSKHKYFSDKSELFKYLINNLTTNILRLLPMSNRELYTVGSMKIPDSINLTYKSIFSSAKRIEMYKNSDNYIHNGRYWFELQRMHNELNNLFLGGNLKFKGTPLKDYPKIIHSKNGIIRGNLLGKRSSFSGRSVNASVEPQDIAVEFDQVIIPLKMAKNLLRVHILKKLNMEHGINFVKAMSMIDDEEQLVLDILKDMDTKYIIYISRAPSLYKMSYVAFYAKFNFDPDDKTLKVHPLQNSSFNLDYDGDTMANFLPITIEAQNEAKEKSLFSKNPFYDKDSSPVYEFSLEFIYGLYYMTDASIGDQVEEFNSKTYFCDYITLGDKKVTYGSNVISQIMKDHGFESYYSGEVINKKVIKSIISRLFKENPDQVQDILRCLNALMIASTRAFSESGLSIKMKDFVKIDKTKLMKTRKIIDYIIEEERLIEELKSKAEPDNAFLSMIDSGTKGNYTQIKQVMISKGVLVDSEGNYLPPIKSSLADGLSFSEFITTIAAGRKGLVSKSLSTAKTGFFYYRLVKSMRDLMIVTDDCGTNDGIRLPVSETEGRFQVKYGMSPIFMDAKEIKNVKALRGDVKVIVRSPITCKAKNGVCQLCYGVNISKNKLIEVGDKIGVITGSTMSEIISQAMLRNFHTAGSTDISKKKVYSNQKIDELDHEVMEDHTLIRLNDYEYLIPNENLNINKTKNIKSDDLVFTYNVSNSDIDKQFKKLECILEGKTPDDQAIISPIDGKLILLEIVKEVVYKVDKSVGLEVPHMVKYVKVKVKSEYDEKVLKLPYDSLMTVPFNSMVKRGQLLTEGNINYKSMIKYCNKEQLIEYLLKDLKDIYLSQGSYVRPIHFELITSHITNVTFNDNGEEKLNIHGITAQGLGRSYIQHLSLGWGKSAKDRVFDDLSQVGITNADKITFGNYD